MSYLEKADREDYLYVLRRTLPQWSWRKNLDELVKYCVEYQIDEVCVKIDTGTFTHYFPSFKWLEKYQKILMVVKKELNTVGVEYSLNPNVTQGHADRGRGIRSQHPNWHMITDGHGFECVDCVCNASPGWRDYFRRQWTLYAETGPATIWIEDDVRTFNHGPVKAGCFCNEHIRRFNEFYGLKMSREDIYRNLVAPGEPNETRRQWLRLLDTITRETVELAEKTVRAVSPETIIGLMSSGPCRHVCEGRDWQQLHHVMAGTGKLPVLSRPPLGSYREFNLPALRMAVDMPRLTRHAFGLDTIDEGEIESYPYSTYSKSNLFLRLHNTAAMAGGCNALTLNLFDHCGTAMAVNRDIAEALLKMKPFLRGVKGKMIPRGKSRGIRLYFNPQIGKLRKLEAGQDSLDLVSDVLGWSGFLQGLGFAVTFDADVVTALAGQDIQAASQAEIMEILGDAVLLDAVAFKTLNEMGYSEYLGGSLQGELKLGTTLPLAGEHFHNAEFGGRKHHYFSLAIHKNLPLFTNIKQSPEAVEISEIVDPDIQRLFGGAYVYENSLGGKIAVYPFEIAKMSEGFMDPARKRMLYSLMTWLSDNRTPLFMGGEREVLPLRCDFESHSVLMFFNLSHDPLENVSAKAHIDGKRVDGAQYLASDGKWPDFNALRIDKEILEIQIPLLTFEQPLFINIRFS